MRTVLHPLAEKAGAVFSQYHGWEIPAAFHSLSRDYEALSHAVGVADLSFRGKLAATGEDRVSFLHAMLTNDVNSLHAGEGAYSFLLNAQGRIQADLHLFRQEHRVLLDCDPFLTEKIRRMLEHYIVMDQVELADMSAQLGTIAVEGPLAARVLSSALAGALDWQMPQLAPFAHASPSGDPDFFIARAAVTGQGFWVVAAQARLAELWEKLTTAARAVGGAPVGFDALELARIEAGIPRYGVDVDDSTLVQETGQMHAVSFTKGCYIGQEIVERVRSRGHVNRALVGLLAPPDKPLRAGIKLRAGGGDAGRITSAAFSPALGRPIALGYVRREFAEPGAIIEAEEISVEVAKLPFVQIQ